MKTLTIVLVFSLLPLSAVADTIALTATDSGWYKSDGSASPLTDQNYIAGAVSSISPEYRDFFVFDLSNVTQTIVSAQLEAYNPSASVVGDFSNGYTSPNASDTYDLFDVSTSIAALGSRSGGVAAFSDLGTGTIYGSHVFTTADNGTLVSIPLDSAALVALNTSHGLFALGGADISVVLGVGRDNIFAFTAGPLGGSPVSDTTRELVIQTVSTPESATGVLLCAGISVVAAIGVFRKRPT